MLPSPATERRKSNNVGPVDLQLTSCEAQRDLVFARAREPLKQRTARRRLPNRSFETPQVKRCALDGRATKVGAEVARRLAPGKPAVLFLACGGAARDGEQGEGPSREACF
jgi:hypothetical protein